MGGWACCSFKCYRHSYIGSTTGEDIFTNRDDVAPLILTRLPAVMIFLSMSLQLYSHQRWGKTIFVVILFIDRKYTQSQERKEMLWSARSKRENWGHRVTGVSSDKLKCLIKLCLHGDISSRVFGTYLLLGRLNGQAQGLQSAGDPRVALS